MTFGDAVTGISWEICDPGKGEPCLRLPQDRASQDRRHENKVMEARAHNHSPPEGVKCEGR